MLIRIVTVIALVLGIQSIAEAEVISIWPEGTLGIKLGIPRSDQAGFK